MQNTTAPRMIRNLIVKTCALIAMSLPPITTLAAPTDTLNIGIGAEFETLNPVLASQAASKYMLYMAYRPLITLTGDNKWIPNIIKDFPSLENKQITRKGKGMDVQIEILENIQWGDGTPVTCKDIELTWKVGINQNVSIPSREQYETITAVTWDKAAPKKCTISMSKARFDYFNMMPDPLPAHLEGPIFEKNKGKREGYDRNSLYVKNPTNPGLYYGPYVITEVKFGSHVSMKPNPKWLGKKPYFQNIVFKLIQNNSVMEANLRSGNINMITPAAGLGVDQAVIFEKKVKAESLPFEVRYEDGMLYHHIDLNLSNPILAEHKVRQALSMAFNKKELINAVLEGKARPATQFVSEKDPWYNDKAKVYEANKRQAIKLLEEAGWKKGASGIREKNGKRLSLTVKAAAGAQINELIEVFMQNNYKDVGIELLVKNEPARVFFGETTKTRNFDMALFSWSSSPELTPRSTQHTKLIPSKENSWTGQNFTGYSNPEVDKLIDELELELDPKKRAELAKKVIAHYTEDIPVIPIYFRSVNAVVPKGMKGFRLIGHQFYESLNVEDWSM